MTQLTWHTYSQSSNRFSDIELDWLFNQGSLTERLIQLSQNAFSLEIVSETLQMLRQDEYNYLNISSLQKQWVREVILKGNDIPWVYARSIILCNKNNQSNMNALTNIGTKSLGSILFEQDCFNRSEIEVTQYPIKLLPFQQFCDNLWARRSRFYNDTYMVVVQEIFLPHFWQTIQSTK
ncbi:chorismate--pyruvate lyase family protein [Commensalibacter nepenthis]|uniref:Probable chorismate pyruvate-lyase n=1 Tax=Commensalibacter nepenthis TaxID=3043872 RepID=A0ABT6Q7Z5_9PROT|nr:chorismate lyase [Commensalibacter sp. TBRC 10068]MDI2112383.1 chorismate lyase [Commensalibacter sp. TBRC 10068]